MMYKILVIEDELDIRELIEQALVIEGYEVAAACNGRVGVELVKKVLPDLILCDINMPELDGFGVITELRNEKMTSAIPVIFLTARDGKSDIREGMNLGADDYLVKPFSIEELKQSIETRLMKTRIFKEKENDKVDDLRLKISMSLPHELRTPLAGIIGFAEMFVNEFDTLSRSEFDQMSELLLENAFRLKNTIEKYIMYTHLLFLSSDRNRAVQLQKSTIQLSDDFVRDCLGTKAEQMKRINDLHIDIDPAQIKIHCDFLKVLIEQLGNNCFDYSPPGSDVFVKGYKAGTEYMLLFEDKGRGMKNDQIEEIGAFNQFDRHIYEQQGTGMGLALAKSIVGLFGARMHFISEYGKGTIVQVTLPLIQE